MHRKSASNIATLAGNIQHRRGWRFSSKIVQAFVFGVSRIWSSWPLNKKKVTNGEDFLSIVDSRINDRKKFGTNSRPLLTICNHTSCVDDALLWGALCRWRNIFSGEMRWIPTAAELTHSNSFTQWLFGHGRCVPVIRGQGVYQQGVDFCIQLLNENQWLQVFPEGKINVDGSKIRLKWGIGRMIMESNIIPEVIPIWLTGFDDVMPNKYPYYPLVGKTVYIHVGKPIDIEPTVNKLKAETSDPMELRRRLTDFIQEEFWKLKETVAEQQKSLHGNTSNRNSDGIS